MDMELAQNGIDFVNRLMSKNPAILFRFAMPDIAEFFFLFALRMLEGNDPLPKSSAAEFWVRYLQSLDTPRKI